MELLEQARGILVTDTVDALSSDLGRLRRDFPGLAEEFANVRGSIDALNRADGLSDPLDLARRRQAAYAAWDDLVARIRKVSSLADFLERPDIRALARQATAGPVIFPYASETGCGALVLTDNPDTPVMAVALDVTKEEVFDQATRLPGESGEDPHGALRPVLAWMWDAVAGPVLAALGHSAIPEGRPWPRVWWCPIGIFAYLPLHAAGYHDHSPRTVMDLVVSSYATTVRGMAYSRALRPDATPAATVVITASDIPGMPLLPGANREAQILTKFIPAATVLRHPTREAVMAALPPSTRRAATSGRARRWSGLAREPRSARTNVHSSAEPRTLARSHPAAMCAPPREPRRV